MPPSPTNLKPFDTSSINGGSIQNYPEITKKSPIYPPSISASVSPLRLDLSNLVLIHPHLFKPQKQINSPSLEP